MYETFVHDLSDTLPNDGVLGYDIPKALGNPADWVYIIYCI